MKNTVILAIAALLMLPLFSIAQAQDTSSNSYMDDYRSDKLKNLGYKKKVKIANNLYDQGSYINALMYYEEAYAVKPDNACLASRLAKLNYLVRDYSKAETYYQKFYDLDPVKYAKAKYMMALMQKYNGKYADAKTNFDGFIAEYNDADGDKAEFQKIVKRQVEGCDLGIKTTSDPERVIVDLLDEKVNNPFSDFAPIAITKDELVYSSLRSEKAIFLPLEGEEQPDSVQLPYSKVFTTKRDGDTWLDSKLFPGPINSDQYHVGNGAFSKDGNRFYFTQCVVGEALKMECTIYVSEKNGNSWNEPVKLDVNADGSTNTHPSVGVMKDGKEYLFFTSTRTEGGEDKKSKKDKLDAPIYSDLYYAEITGPAKTGPVKNLGNKINTAFNEATPFYDNNTHTLYFSSEGYVNIGGYDIYSVTHNGTDWDTVTNLLAPINSSVDDLYFNLSSDGRNGFLVSNRPGGYGLKSATCCDDIYGFRIVKEVNIRILVAERRTPETPLAGADVSVVKGKDGYNTPVGNFTTTEGEAVLFALQPDEVYTLNATKTGYWGNDTILDANALAELYGGKDTMDLVILIDEIARQKIKLKRVYYDFDKYNLTKQYKVALDSIQKLMADNPTWTIEIYGHTDSIGSDAYNMVLAKRRAQTCADYLASKGIDIARISLMAMGRQYPQAPNKTETGADNPKGRAKNRRAEFKVNTNDNLKQVEIEYTDNGPYVKYIDNTEQK